MKFHPLQFIKDNMFQGGLTLLIIFPIVGAVSSVLAGGPFAKYDGSV